MKPTYNRLKFDYGFDGEALQEIVNGTQTRIVTLDGQDVALPDEYGCSVVEADIPTPAWAQDVPDPTVELPAPPAGFTYVLTETPVDV
jgi:hypothetical protein